MTNLMQDETYAAKVALNTQITLEKKEYPMTNTHMIKDDDVIYKKLDEYNDNDEQEEIIKTILDIPFEKWSNKLWFRLIAAYNNFAEYKKSADELEKIRPRCDNPKDLSRWYYMNGYIYYANDNELMAIHYYEDAIEADPDNTTGMNLKKESEDAWKYVQNDLEKLRNVSDGIAEAIKNICALKPEKEKFDLSDESFTLELGFLPGIRKVPGQERGLGFNDDDYFKKFTGERKEIAQQWLEQLYDITDLESFKQFFHTSHYCNTAHFTNDVLALMNKKPNFDLSRLNKDGERMFYDMTLLVSQFAEYLPKAGTYAWDLGEKIGFARIAYAVDYLTNSDYCSCMMAILEEAKNNFSSMEEYMMSLTFGSAVYMFMVDDHCVNSASKFLAQMSKYILNSDLPHIIWKNGK